MTFGASAASALVSSKYSRELVNAEAIPHESSKAAPHITISQGVVTARPDSELEPADLVNLADKALYRAKQRGRNRVCM